ncbi:MAG: hypothetical protein HZA60_02150 [Deltaproteobacteria bacterium]|nr:hypothetical protein [Deltaproteobacteria bacterium]
MPRPADARRFAPFPILLLVAAAVAGCSTGNENGAVITDTQGNHPAGWIAAHPAFAISGTDKCTPCHGDTLTGGIAKVSCFTAACHHGTIPTWSQPAVHGAAAKKAPGGSGFVSCRICHGSNFSGGGAGVSCFTCHGVNAPHPPRPWRAAGPGTTHTNTDPANASVCGQCHQNGANSTRQPASPAPPGTPPGCFNNTLCHGTEVAPHILGAAWRDPAVGGSSFHGLTAKANLAFCQTCHGTPGTISFDGGVAPTKCSTCHTAAKAHPTTWFAAPSPFPNYAASHRDSGNRSVVCAICHNVTGPGAGPMSGAPSCFSASFTNADDVVAACHVNGPGAPNHALPFFDNTHFQATQAAFTSNCSNCHAITGTSPVSAAPLCTVCHAAGSPLTLTNCTSCHGNPPNGGAGAAYANIAGGHAGHIALNTAGTPISCNTCHNGLGSQTLAHYNRANGRPGAGGRVPPGDMSFQSPFPYNAKAGAAAFDNTLTVLACSNVSCHGAITTPNWQTGAINVNADAGCRQCHKAGTALGVPENNSYFSGRHALHLGGEVGALCTECHNMTLATTGAQNHFKSLGTPQMEGPASDTFQNSTGTVVYTPATRRCNGTCHGEGHENEVWQ